MRVAITCVVSCALLGLASQASSQTSAFRGSISRLSPEYRAHMSSWYRRCPVPRSRLRLLRVTYLGFDGATHRGSWS